MSTAAFVLAAIGGLVAAVALGVDLAASARSWGALCAAVAFTGVSAVLDGRWWLTAACAVLIAAGIALARAERRPR